MRLILNSNQIDAVLMYDWIVEDVLPNIQNTKEYKLFKNSMTKYIK